MKTLFFSRNTINNLNEFHQQALRCVNEAINNLICKIIFQLFNKFFINLFNQKLIYCIVLLLLIAEFAIEIDDNVGIYDNKFNMLFD